MSPFLSEKRPGNPAELLRIVWPLALAMLAGTVCHVCDRIFLAQSSDTALEAIAPAFIASVLPSGFLAAVIGYSATLVAQFHGGGDGHQAVQSFAQGLWMTFFSLPVFILYGFCGDLLIGIGSHADAVRAAELAYFRITAPGGFLVVLNTVLAGILTGQGHTCYAGGCAFLGSLANLTLDPLLILTLDMGIRGAATAVILSNAAVTVLLSLGVIRDKLVRQGLASGDFALRPPLVSSIVRFGGPVGVTTLCDAVAFAVFTFAAGRCDGLVFAASNAVFAVNNVYFLLAGATAQGVTILTGRYHGAKNADGVNRTFISGLWLAGIAFLLFFATTLPTASFIFDQFQGAGSLFDRTDFHRCGMNLLLILIVREVAEGALLVISAALKGIGDTRYLMKVQISMALLFRIPLILAVCAFSSSMVLLWLTMPLDMGITAVLLIHRLQDRRLKLFPETGQ